MLTENDLVVEDTIQSANEYGFDDRYKPQYDFVWRRALRLLKSSYGSRRAYYDALS
jgi:hypothetical protein